MPKKIVKRIPKQAGDITEIARNLVLSNPDRDSYEVLEEYFTNKIVEHLDQYFSNKLGRDLSDDDPSISELYSDQIDLTAGHLADWLLDLIEYDEELLDDELNEIIDDYLTEHHVYSEIDNMVRRILE